MGRLKEFKEINLNDELIEQFSGIINKNNKISAVCISGQHYSHFMHYGMEQLLKEPSVLSYTFHIPPHYDFSKAEHSVYCKELAESLIATALLSYRTLEICAELHAFGIQKDVANIFIYKDNGELLGGISIFFACDIQDVMIVKS